MTIDRVVDSGTYSQEVEEYYQGLEKKYPEQKEKINTYKVRLLALVNEYQQNGTSYKVSGLIRDRFSSDECHLENLQHRHIQFTEAAAKSSSNRETLKNQLSISQSIAAAGVGVGLLIGGGKATEKAAIRELLDIRVKSNALEKMVEAIAKEERQSGSLGNLKTIVQNKHRLVEQQVLRAEEEVVKRVFAPPIQRVGRITLGAAAGAAAGGIVGAVVGLAITAATSDSLNEGEVPGE